MRHDVKPRLALVCDADPPPLRLRNPGVRWTRDAVLVIEDGAARVRITFSPRGLFRFLKTVNARETDEG